MNTLNPAVSTAIRVQSARERKPLTAIAEEAGISQTSFFDRLANKRNWDIEQLESIAKAINLPSAFDLFSIAKTEADIASSSEPGESASLPTEKAA